MILLYHHIGPGDVRPRNPGPPEGEESAFTADQLEAHLNGLTARGFRFVRLPDLVSAIARRGWEPWKEIALTFDDGWTDNYTHALPVLCKLDIPATFFVTTEHIHKRVGDPTRMSIGQLRELLRCNMTIGAHSRTHPNLLQVSQAQAAEEIAGSKSDLEQALGTSIDLFAYPYGTHHREQVNLVRAAGYTAAVSAGDGAQNTALGLFWLFRYGLTADLDDLANRRALNPASGTVRGLYLDLRKRLGWPLRALLPSAPPTGRTSERST